MILDELWDSTGDYVDNNTLSVYVRRLREKVGQKNNWYPASVLTYLFTYLKTCSVRQCDIKNQHIVFFYFWQISQSFY